MMRTRGVKRGLLAACLLCLLALCGCDQSSQPYEAAAEAFGKSDFETARTLLADLPADYKEVGLYRNALAAIDAYEADDWTAAMRAFDGIYQRWDARYNGDKPFSQGFKPMDYCFPLNAKILEIREGKGDPYFTDNANAWGIYARGAYSSGYEKFGQNMLWESGYLYYREQFRQGKDLGALAEFPLTRDNPQLRRWTAFRTDRLSDALRADGELAAYYKLTDDSISPVPVTGNGLYVYRRDDSPGGIYFNQRATAGINLDLTDVLSPFCYADSPEDLRYVLSLTQTYTSSGYYSDGSTAYQVRAHVTIKDVSTGALLLDKVYTADPKQKILENEQRVSSLDFGPESEAFTQDILPVLAALYPVMR